MPPPACGAAGPKPSAFQVRKSVFYHYGRAAAERALQIACRAQRELLAHRTAAAFDLLGLAIDQLALLEDLAAGRWKGRLSGPENEKKQSQENRD